MPNRRRAEALLAAGALAAAAWLALPARVGAGTAPPPRKSTRVRLLVPAYFYPGGTGLRHWDAMIAAARDAPIIAIANPGSGPGRTADPNYTRVLERAAAAGIILVGYVSTSYAKRPEADVTADADTWLRLYPQLKGFFFDEQTSGAERVDYYEALYRHARLKVRDALVITNPGTTCDPAYLLRPAADVACLFENHSGFDAWRKPEWAATLPPERVAALPYDVPAEPEMRRLIARALRDGIGTFYVTDDAGANPWDRLPTYWAAEVREVAAANRR